MSLHYAKKHGEISLGFCAAIRYTFQLRAGLTRIKSDLPINAPDKLCDGRHRVNATKRDTVRLYRRQQPPDAVKLTNPLLGTVEFRRAFCCAADSIVAWS